MTDLEKAKYVLEMLSTKNYELEGIEDAFRLTQAYSWLFKLVAEMEKPSKKEDPKKGKKK